MPYKPKYIITPKINKALVEIERVRDFLDEWIRAINAHGGFGKWTWVVSRHPSDLEGILESD